MSTLTETWQRKKFREEYMWRVMEDIEECITGKKASKEVFFTEFSKRAILIVHMSGITHLF